MEKKDILGPIKFGTGGWRGIIGDDFIKYNIQRVAYAIGLMAQKEGKTDMPIPIGYDRRFLSETARTWVAEVLTGMGFKTVLMQRSTPTPLIMFMVKDQGWHYGIEITASHNPSDYNGIKLIVEEGRDASVAETEMLESLINESVGAEIPVKSLNDAEAEGLVTYLRTPFNDFIDHILLMLNQDAIRQRSPRILFDPMHGSGTYPLMVILQTLRCTVDLINDNKDAYFGGNMPAPTAKGLVDLRSRVVNGGYDLGIAFDGDGDRLGIVDEHGNYIDANQILCLLYYYLRKYKGWNGPVVRNLATTHMLDAIAASFGEACHEVPIGFKYISAAIDRYDAVLGGESSGGLTVRGHIYGKDSIYAASLFVEMLCVTGLSPSALIAELEDMFGHYEMIEANLKFDPAVKSSIVQRLMVNKEIPNFEGEKIAKVGYEDGCKVYFEDGSFVICRFSGTEPLLRIFAEASDRSRALGYIGEFKKMLGL